MVTYRIGERRRTLRRKLYGSLMLLAVFLAGLISGVTFLGRDGVSAALAKAGSLKTTSGWGMMPGAKIITAATSKHKGGGGATTASSTRSQDCSAAPAAHANLASAQSSQLRKLAEYEQVCGAAIVSRSMFFTATPKDTAEAQSYAADVSATLHDYAHYGIAPLVILEPNTSSGPVNFKDYRNGAYDQALDAYFAALKASGITDAQMGMWVSFPEANIPEWGTTDPNDFAANVTKTIQFQKKYFAGSLASVMLDSKTYPSGTSWDNGSYASLLPYVQPIPHGLVDSFGLQGFPWTPPANQGGPASTDPAEYLSAAQAAEAARSLGVHNVWFNTGTFGRAYTNDASQTVSLSPAQRQAMLDGITAQAKALQAQGFAAAVHLFAQDKSATSEAIDWAYWPKGQAATSPATPVFKIFTHDLQAAGIPLWLFDTDEQ